MKVEKVSVGLVGLGMVCESHLKAYSAHPDAKVLAVCDLDADRSKEIANKYLKKSQRVEVDYLPKKK